MKSVMSPLHDEGVRSVVSLVIGFMLAQLGGYFAERMQRKKAVAHALSELLEVRHQLIGLENVMEQIGDLAGSIPEHEKAQIRVVLDSLLPKWDEAHSRYEQSITTLAGLDPLLAFRLRSKDFIRPMLTWLHSLMGQDPKAAALFGPILRGKLLSKIEPVLNKAVMRLAKKKSLLCWYSTRRLLKQDEDVADELKDLLEPLKAIVEAQKQAATAATATVAKG